MDVMNTWYGMKRNISNSESSEIVIRKIALFRNEKNIEIKLSCQILFMNAFTTLWYIFDLNQGPCNPMGRPVFPLILVQIFEPSELQETEG